VSLAAIGTPPLQNSGQTLRFAGRSGSPARVRSEFKAILPDFAPETVIL
jgi:hypothetical protein